jgi:hypothetical protein
MGQELIGLRAGLLAVKTIFHFSSAGVGNL